MDKALLVSPCRSPGTASATAWAASITGGGHHDPFGLFIFHRTIRGDSIPSAQAAGAQADPTASEPGTLPPAGWSSQRQRACERAGGRRGRHGAGPFRRAVPAGRPSHWFTAPGLGLTGTMAPRTGYNRDNGPSSRFPPAGTGSDHHRSRTAASLERRTIAAAMAAPAAGRPRPGRPGCSRLAAAPGQPHRCPASRTGGPGPGPARPGLRVLRGRRPSRRDQPDR